MSDYRLVEANAAGRDFVVGDIHGMFGRVEEALSKVNFDPSRDRLFCVGDLIDRGPRSGEVVRFLDQPFVHAVCGNHEDALLQVHAGSSRPNSETWLDGADWWHELSQDERRTVISRLERLPLVIEVPTPRGNVAFLHGDVPRGMHWSDFRVALKTEPEKIRNTALWGRSRIGRGDDSGVPGIGRVFVGHTPQWGGLRRYGNVYAIDTGAVFGWMGRDGHLTCVNIQSPTEGLVEVRQVGTLGVDALDQPAPDRPFGSYARPMPNTPQGRSKAIEGTVENRASRSRMNQETGRVDSRHVEKMPVEVLERLLTTPFRKKYVYFREYTERRPKHAWNHKPIVGPPDRPFAELQYVQRLESEGWIAGWCYRPGKFISSWEPEKRPVLFPTEAQELLARIARRAGEKAGCWDVFAWKDGSPLFVELKRRRSGDRLRDGQKRWRDAASQLGVPASAFLEVEWLGGCLDGYSLKAMSLFQARIDSWVRYRRGKYEFGGPDPSEAKDWLELYRQRTGLEGADLLWVLFRDNAGGTTTYWSIEQSRDRTR